MKLKTIFVVAFFLLCLVGNAMAADQEITVEFSGPWCIYIGYSKPDCGGTLDKCVVAISTNNLHQRAVFAGSKSGKSPLETGVYTLAFNGIQNSDQTYTPALVPAKGDRGTYQDLLYASDEGKPQKPRYTVILPYAPSTSFETKGYMEEVSITEQFKPPAEALTEQPQKYAKSFRIHYKVSDLKATLTGRKDGAKKDMDPISKKASIRFVVDPKDANYFCDIYARQAFKDMNLLLNTSPRLHVDFPHYTGDCREWDPQEFDDEMPTYIPLIPMNPDEVNESAISNMMVPAKHINAILNSNVSGATKADIDQLLDDSKAYLLEAGQYLAQHRHQALQNQRKPVKISSYDAKGKHLISDGEDLVHRLDNARNALYKAYPTDTKTLSMVHGLGIVLDLVVYAKDSLQYGMLHPLNPGSGANCKAPIMNITF